MQDTSILKEIKLVVYDFDGVMTDNRVLVREDGMEAVFCNRSDGLGIGIIRKLGIDQVILSTEQNPVVRARARKLHMDCVHGCRDKAEALGELAKARGVELSEIMFVGNDTNDRGAMELARVAVAPADAHPEIISLARFVTAAAGGAGVVRELADMFTSCLS